MDEILTAIKKGTNFLIISHVRPDGDAISSQLVISKLLSAIGKNTYCVNENLVPSNLKFLEYTTEIKTINEVDLEKIDTVLSVDTSNIDRFGRSEEQHV